jgi:hypothetical protein
MVVAKIRLPARMVHFRRRPRPQSALHPNGPTRFTDVLPVLRSPAISTTATGSEIDAWGYSNATATHFNGFHPETLIVTNDQPMAAG